MAVTGIFATTVLPNDLKGGITDLIARLFIHVPLSFGSRPFPTCITAGPLLIRGTASLDEDTEKFLEDDREVVSCFVGKSTIL